MSRHALQSVEEVNRLSLVKKTPKRSQCCRAKIFSSLSDGVIVGSCSKCNTNIVRLNPRTGNQEWLHGESPWSRKDAEK